MPGFFCKPNLKFTSNNVRKVLKRQCTTTTFADDDHDSMRKFECEDPEIPAVAWTAFGVEMVVELSIFIVSA